MPDYRDRYSRDPQSQSASPEAKMTAESLPTATAANESKLTNHENSSYGQREGKWSDEIVLLAGEMQDQQRSSAPMPPLTGTGQEPLSFNHQQEHAKSVAARDAEGQQDYSQLYLNQASSDTSGMEMSQCHTPYRSFRHQDCYSQHYQSADQQQQHNYLGERPPTSHLTIPDISLKEDPSAVTESAHNATLSRISTDLVLSSSLEGDRKPFAVRSMEDKPLKGILKKESTSIGTEITDISLNDDRDSSAASAYFRGILNNASHSQYQGQLDFEPIPLHEMAFIPRLSSSEADTFRPPAHPRIADTVSVSHSHDAFPRVSPQASMLPDSFAAAPQLSEAQITPVISPQFKPATRKQRKKPAQGSSYNTTSSKEGDGWERRYNELIEFRRRKNHCDVPQNYPKNTSLGTWVNKQRMEHKNRVEGKNSSLNDYRLGRLESIGFRWAKRKGQANWDEKFSELVAYKAKFGNCLVPTKYNDNTALGRWVSTQRSEYKKYHEGEKRTSINPDKIRRLESIGFAWFMAL